MASPSLGKATAALLRLGAPTLYEAVGGAGRGVGLRGVGLLDPAPRIAWRGAAGLRAGAPALDLARRRGGPEA